MGDWDTQPQEKQWQSQELKRVWGCRDTQPQEKQWKSHRRKRVGEARRTAAGEAVVVARVGVVRRRWGAQQGEMQ